MTEKARSDGYTAPAVDKALDVLEALAAQPAGASTSELSRALGRSVGEIYRVVLTLERRHYIAKEPDTDRFYLTLRLFELAHRHPPTLRLVRAAQPILDEIAAETLQSCHLVVAQGDEAIIIAGADSPMPMRYGVRVGARFPLFETSSGVVIAAFGSDRARRDAGGEEALASYGERIERIRSLGYEVWDSQVVRGVTNLATPVLDHAGRSCAALTVPYLEQLRATPTRKDVLERLVLEARRLSWTMGHDGETVAEPQDQGDQLRKATP